MNAYDFDGTIYNGDSGVEFIKFMFFKKPFFMAKHLVKASIGFIKYKLKKIEFKEMKENLFSFVSKIDSLEKYTAEFAEKNKDKIKKYYFTNRKEDDVVVSASLDFYLIPLCKVIGINTVICTKYDIKNGKIINANCKNAEKVKRLEEQFGKDVIIENAYGDSKGDYELLCRAKEGFWIKGEEVVQFKR